MNGYIYFSDPPDHYTYPLEFPSRDWPRVNDPAFIGIFFSKCRIGSMRPEEPDQRRPGVYFRLDKDLQVCVYSQIRKIGHNQKFLKCIFNYINAIFFYGVLVIFFICSISTKV